LTQLETIETRRGPEGQVIIETAKGDQFIPRMINIFADGGDPLEVHSVNLRRPTLEDVFIKLTGRAIREEEASGKDQMRLRRRMFHR